MIFFVIFIVITVTSTLASVDIANSKASNGLSDESYFNCRGIHHKVTRFPDKNDCTRFIYCVSGVPYSAKCYPLGSRFNPLTKRCNLPIDAPCGDNSNNSDATTVTTTPLVVTSTFRPVLQNVNLLGSSSQTVVTTTTSLRPTTKKPQLLADTFRFSLSCGKTHPCGLYPNHNENCSTFILCKDDGEEVIKNCNGGQLYDVYTMECQPAEKATCFKVPDNGPFIKRKLPPQLCNFHGYNSSFSDTNETLDEMILSSPVVTNRGEWQPWKFCPNGTYITGINAWRRLLQSGQKSDHAGLVSVGLQCQPPDGSRSNILENVAPGAPNDGFPSFYSCTGGGSSVGFRLNSQRDQGTGGDNLGTDNVQLLCSCGPPVHKPYETFSGPQNGNRGEWTQVQNCRPRTALCGVQTQMAIYREGVIGQYDNTGLNNVRMKCCPVPDLAEICNPAERLELIRSCSNTQGIYPRRCDFQVMIGLSYDEQDSSLLRSANFHQSIGYTLEEAVEKLKERFESAETIGGLEHYSWKDSESTVWIANNVNSTWMDKVIFLQQNTTVEVFQVLGTCGHFAIRTNRFVRKTSDLTVNTGNSTTEYFDII